MKKNVLFIAIFIMFFSVLESCEKDEICLEEITPRLIIRFYDATDPEDFKQVTSLKVNIEGIDGDYENETITFLTDSIAIPIKVTEDITKIKLTLNGKDADETNDNEDTFEIRYIREDEFVSRSCGYKTIFYDGVTSLEDDGDNWVISLETIDTPQDILNEKSAHVKIFH